jgi:hypothetical protein
MMMQAIRPSEKLVHTRATRCIIPEDGILHGIYIYMFMFINYLFNLSLPSNGNHHTVMYGARVELLRVVFSARSVPKLYNEEAVVTVEVS